MGKEQKQYGREFKKESVEYFLSQDKPAKKIAEHFGVKEKTFYYIELTPYNSTARNFLILV